MLKNKFLYRTSNTLPSLHVHSNRTGRGKGDEKSLTLRHIKHFYYGPPAQNRTTLLVRLPSGEYKSKQCRHVRFFQLLCLDFYATLGVTHGAFKAMITISLFYQYQHVRVYRQGQGSLQVQDQNCCAKSGDGASWLRSPPAGLR